jgi:L-lactate dehydrogenase complex protein LldE
MPSVTLFVPCLVDQVSPEIGVSSFQLLRHAGFDVSYFPEATCCGQPAFNAGHQPEALRVARHFVDTLFEADAPLVCPSGSCTAMVQKFHPMLDWSEADARKSRAVSGRVVELSRFLVRAGALASMEGRHEGVVAFHNSCHAFRELGIDDEPWALLDRVSDARWVDVGEPVCCGFGGLFSLELPSTAATMAKSRLEPFVTKGVETLVSNDPGCVMHLKKEAESLGYDLDVVHLAVFMARSLGLPTDTLELPRER